MRKKKKFIALAMAVVMGVTSVPFPQEEVQASEVAQEYVVLAKNEAGYEEVQEMPGVEVAEETVESTVLEENHIAVVELTETEAEKLEDDKNILFVEEDIVLEGSGAKKEKNKEEKEEEKKALQRKKEQKKKKEQLWKEREAEEKRLEETELEYEWNLKAIEADEVLEGKPESAQKVKVAVLDSGVDYVSGINLEGYVNFVDEEEISPIFQDASGHGTGIASIITGNGETGICGVNPNVELYSVKIMDENNAAPLSRVIRGIYWCIENDVNIINMSFGTKVYSKVLEQAVKDAYDAGILMVAAAGNGSTEVEYPAAFPEVMAVVATNPEAQISNFSNTGEELDVAAPGEKIRVAGFFNGSVVTHGTSIAVPHVVGVASLLWEKDLEKSQEFIRQLIEYSAKEIEGTDDCGLLDAEYALSLYDTFAKNFDAEEMKVEKEVPMNETEPESFEEVNLDETYVEGRWNKYGHLATLGSCSMKGIELVKKGILFPDHYEPWDEGKKNPRWHGKWRSAPRKLLNYIAVVEMITDAAIWDDVGLYSYYKTVGLDKETYDLLKTDIQTFDFGTMLSGDDNTPENRKYFLYGCALHTITDVFAHSTARKVNGGYVRIGHQGDNDADNTEIYKNRHDIACRIAQYGLECLENNCYVDGSEVLSAVKKELKGTTPKFRVIDLKENIMANGYTVNEEVKMVTISSSQVKMSDGSRAD